MEQVAKREDFVKIETKLEHLATREAVADVKTLIEKKESTLLKWLAGKLATAAITLVFAIVRSFM